MVNVQQLIYLHIFDSRNQNLFEIYLKSIFEAYLLIMCWMKREKMVILVNGKLNSKWYEKSKLKILYKIFSFKARVK